MKGRPRMKAHTTIDVTAVDIARAERDNSYKCVVAQAIARTIPTATRIEVDTQTIRFTSDGQRFVYLTPYAVQGYVIAFDAGERPEPFKFQLRGPIRVKRTTRTAAGLAAHRARNAVERSKEAAPREPTSVVPLASEAAPRARKTPEKKRADARAAYAQARAENPGKGRSSDGGGRAAPPRVFKTKSRSYGHRLLRINQEPV